MNYLKIAGLVLCAFFSSLLDTSFFSAMPVFGATILSTLVIVLTLSVSKELRPVLAYSISAVVFFSAFSSLPIWLILLIFFCVPYFIHFIQTKYFPKISILMALPFFLFGTVIFSAILLFYNKGWNAEGVIILIYFMLMNSALGLGLLYIVQRWERDFGRKEIKF